MTKQVKPYSSEFPEVLTIIKDGRSRAFQAVNIALIETYWAVGDYLSRKVATSGWGKGVVRELADWLLVNAPDAKGFSAPNLWRMMQLYDTYAGNERLAPLVRALRDGLNIVLKCSRMEPVSNEDKSSTTDHFPGAGKMVRETNQWIIIR